MRLSADRITTANVNPDDFGPNGSFNPQPEVGDLLGYLTWIVSAASVGGLLVVGIQMALQLRRGEMGEGATYFRGGVFVVMACVLGTTAGPIVNFLL
ncbi:hypothetical protein [Streptomyces broussonetiae]|uniref:DUF4190 domain-containing protein n=1 Tax=Streptomyces broussonetiae TaxID=2686304 RepID=A0ABV5E6C4_9ACTN